MMLRSVWLTFRMHRFEVLLAAVLLALTAVSALIAESHVAAADPGADCWKVYWSSPTASTCSQAVQQFWAAAAETTFVASPVAVSLPFLVGLLLGVPIVGRELEMRTAGLAWSLSGRRWRWLLARFVPMLILGGGGLLVVALIVADMQRVAHPWNYLGPGRIPDLTEIGSEGLPMAARGLMTLGIGLLAGAVFGRTLPAFAIGAVACFVLLFVGEQFLQAQVGQSVAVWQTQDQPSLVVPWLLEFGYRAPDGSILTFDQGQQLADQQCAQAPNPTPAPPGPLPDPEPDCIDNWLQSNNYVDVSRVVPLSAYPVFEKAEIIVASAIGLLCMLLTFPIVSRRRPT